MSPFEQKCDCQYNGGHLGLLIGFGECSSSQKPINYSTPRRYLHLLNKLLYQILLLVACHYIFIWLAPQSTSIFIPHFIPNIKCCLKAAHLLNCLFSLHNSHWFILLSSFQLKSIQSQFTDDAPEDKPIVFFFQACPTKLANLTVSVHEETARCLRYSQGEKPFLGGDCNLSGG